MKKLITLLIILFPLVGCEKPPLPDIITATQSKYKLKCEKIADRNNLYSYRTSILRCENTETVCYFESDSMQCKFK